MTEQRLTPKDNLYDVVLGILADQNGHFTDTHPRFSLATDNSIDVLVTSEDAPERSRVLVVQEDEDTDPFYVLLEEVGIPQFERRRVDEDTAIYSLPLDVKPFVHERLFVGHASTETYVSDHEIFTQMGKLWAAIYRATSSLPTAPISATALQNFEDLAHTLIPIPPYAYWEKYETPSAAMANFLSHLADELAASNPGISYSTLVQAAETGWHLDARH